MGVKSEKGASLISLFLKYVLLSLCIVSVVTFWGEDKWNPPEDGRGTDASRVIMTSREAAQGLLQLWAHQWSRSHQRDVLWALLYLDRPVHTGPRWTQPIWAGHCNQEVLQEENLPFHPNIHTYCCSLCIFLCYNKHIFNHHQNIDALSSNLHLLSLRICSAGLHISKDICEHRYMHNNQGECDSSSINFSILYITYSHIFWCGLLRS